MLLLLLILHSFPPPQVFEDDWIMSQATDSGCSSESLLEEEGALDKANLDLPATSNRPEGKTDTFDIK